MEEGKRREDKQVFVDPSLPRRREKALGEHIYRS